MSAEKLPQNFAYLRAAPQYTGVLEAVMLDTPEAFGLADNVLATELEFSRLFYYIFYSLPTEFDSIIRGVTTHF